MFIIIYFIPQRFPCLYKTVLKVRGSPKKAGGDADEEVREARKSHSNTDMAQPLKFCLRFNLLLEMFLIRVLGKVSNAFWTLEHDQGTLKCIQDFNNKNEYNAQPFMNSQGLCRTDLR
jgi:hypothetical protein